ncbi:MAG TPA: hypothetical protein VHX86_03365 [Tepidisphaeraceae bacterium]|jgi:hypothetical protein|nr:hypothetical protein [Tepidisphaeraceae bacterium]
MTSKLEGLRHMDVDIPREPTWLGTRLTALAQRLGEAPTGFVVSLACFAFSLFMIFPMQPAYVLLGGQMDSNTYGDLTYTSRFYFSYLPISQNPFTKTPTKYLFTRHRVLGPLIAHYTDLGGRKSVLVPLAANFLLLWAIYTALRKRDLPYDLCAIITATMSLTLVVATSQAWAGYQDSLGCLAIALALCIESIPLAALAFLVGMFAEERILVAGPLFVLWHAMNETDGRWLRRAVLRSASLVLVLGLWLIYYIALQHSLSIKLSNVTNVAFEDFRQYKSYVWPGFYYGLRAAWLLPAILVGRWVLQRGKRGHAALLAASIAVVFIVSLRVGDISRVCCLAFPAVLLGAVYLYRSGAQSLRYYALAAFALNIVSPCLSVTQYHMRFFYPLPIAVPELIHQLRHPG